MMRRNGASWRMRWLLLAVGLSMMALAGAILAAALQPAMADRFGYALARSNGLPGHFTYQNLTYSAPDFCAGGAGCDPTRAARMTEDALRAQGQWPLKQVASLPTLFGASHPILDPINDLSMSGAGSAGASDVTPLTLYIADPAAPAAYVIYMRGGGP